MEWPTSGRIDELVKVQLLRAITDCPPVVSIVMDVATCRLVTLRKQRFLAELSVKREQCAH
eukprot:scaffold9176_cov129-Cylindrotheca_fusiformis.AAC.14